MSRSKTTLSWIVVLGLCLLPAAAAAKTVDSHSEKIFDAIPGGTVAVDVSFHDVVVEVRPGEQVKITVDIEVKASPSKAEDMIEDLAPKFSQRDDTISVRSERHGSFGFSFFGSTRAEGKVVVKMPPGMNLEVDVASGDVKVRGDLGDARLEVDTASGEVDADGAAQRVLVDSASGDVHLDLSRPAETVKVDTASGEVFLRGGAADLRVDTASGDVSATGLIGAAVLDTASGEVRARWTEVPVDVRVSADTASGDVRLSFPPATELNGKLSTSSGDITSDFSGQRRDKGRLFDLDGAAGGVRLRVDTASGDIEIIEN